MTSLDDLQMLTEEMEDEDAVPEEDLVSKVHVSVSDRPLNSFICPLRNGWNEILTPSLVFEIPFVNALLLSMLWL